MHNLRIYQGQSPLLQLQNDDELLMDNLHYRVGQGKPDWFTVESQICGASFSNAVLLASLYGSFLDI